MIQYKVSKVGEDTIMITRYEPFEKPIEGLPPYLTSTLACKVSELPQLINVLSDYVNETK